MEEVSVIMSTYNGHKFLEEQISSIQNQKGNGTDFKLQLYIRDDKSNDGTLDVISNFSNVTIVPNNGKNVGVKASFFELLDIVPDSELIFFSDQDDIWPTDKVKKFLDVYHDLSEQQKQSPVGIFSDLWVANSDGISTGKRMSEVIGWAPESDYLYLSWSHKITGAAFAINSAAKNVVRTVDPVMRENINMHDSFIGLLISITGHLIQIDEPLLMYRQHGNNVIGAKKKRSIFLKAKSIFKLATRLYNDDINAYKWMQENQEQFLFNEGAFSYFGNIFISSNEKFLQRFRIWQSMLKYMMSSRLPFTTFCLYVLKFKPKGKYWEL